MEGFVKSGHILHHQLRAGDVIYTSSAAEGFSRLGISGTYKTKFAQRLYLVNLAFYKS